MAPSGKTAEGRRKSGGKPSLLVTLAVSSSRLREILVPDSIKEDTPSAKEVPTPKDVKDSPANSAAPVNSNGENASDSNAATPAAEGTPAPSAMGPPTEGPKKKGTKRSAAGANGATDGSSKPRGKPGPKKKPRLEDGTIDPAANRTGGGHKLGPKANQGAINAGLRALDRSGKPCRKWAVGGFTLKSFTGVVWEVSRWRAPPKAVPEPADDESGAPSADNSSSKENKENGPEANSGSNSNSGADVELRSVHSVTASSPAPMAVTAAS
ncbi:INO80 complex subunit ies4 domain-containing protein [Hirsutella rhossiliensis]|uniref:INO80 complex subunit ies4 domain-containing protein n=1 Tax=Hirsutella rhossiliensis TaxID=111463 RepID=A0A9P8MQK3_9HYPO|nr:INO80 complex subunit ies4 domain-containing protein [Hirsutella rhossiliensis]KAH0959470.1 INO80 complex subunit ies4 domain-containing protein [Hirsutella rhossiliensis]